MKGSAPFAGSLRRPELDGLRGLAAFSVLLFHAISIIPDGPAVTLLETSLLHAFWDGTAAVDLFFVLSGFVLALPFVGSSDRPIEYASFVVRRVFRILPAYWLSLVVALALRCTLFEPGGLETLSPWVRGMWRVSPDYWVDHLILIGPWSRAELINPVFGPQGMHQVNPVIWTLVVEMRISLVYPLAIPLIRRANDLRSVSLLLLLSVTLVTLVPALWALPLFMLGGLLAHHRPAVARWCGRKSPALVAGLWLLALALYDFRFVIPGFHPAFAIAHYVSGCGAALILVLAMQGLAARFLNSPPVRFLGDISYGAYLFHLPILITVGSQSTKLVGTPFGAWALACALTLVLTIAISAISYRFVEEPAQGLGRSLCARISRWRQTIGVSSGATRGGAPARDLQAFSPF